METGTKTIAESTSPTLEACVDSFRRHLRGAKSKNTLRLYVETVEQLAAFLSDQGMPRRVSSVRAEHIEVYFEHLRELGRSDNTVSARYRALRAFFRWAVKPGREIQTHPMDGMNPPRVSEQPADTPTDDEIAALLKACQGKGFPARRDDAMIRLAFDAGLRRAELTALTKEDIDLDAKVVRIMHGKGDRFRLAAFGDRTAEAIDRYMRTRQGHRYHYRPELWLGERGALGSQGFYHMLAARTAAAGITLRPHQLRHFFAHEAKRRGMSDEQLMALGGWKSAETLKRYGQSLAAQRAVEAYHAKSAGDRF